MEQVAKLHDLATAFIHGETAVFGERTHASYRDSLSDILGDALAVDWNYLELPVDDFFTFTAMSDSIYGSAPRPDEALSMAESGNPTQFREPPPPL
jgi:hypothetical protein